jgi:hypothetical protein
VLEITVRSKVAIARAAFLTGIPASKGRGERRLIAFDMAELLDEVAEILFISAGADIGPNTWASNETFRLSHTSSSAYAVLKIVGVRRGDRLP